MKILMIHNRYRQKGGEDAVFDAEADMLSRGGHDVTVLEESNDDIQSIWNQAVSAVRAISSSSAKRRVADLINKMKPDVVHVHNFFPKLSPSIFGASRELNVPTVLTLHNFRLICPSATFYVDGSVNESSLQKSSFRMVPKKVYRNSVLGTAAVASMIEYHKFRGTWRKDVDAFIALTDFAKKKFVQANVPAQKIYVKPNFLPEKMMPVADTTLNVQRNGALYVGRLTKEKGVFTMLESWRQIDFPLRIAGGPVTVDLKKIAPANVEFLGHLSREEVHQEMRQSAFMIMPSEWYEGFPVTLIEAYMNGLPVVASDIGSLTELVLDGVTGFHFQAGNVRSLENVVGRMIAMSQDERNQLGSAAQSRAVDKYSEGTNLDQLVTIYESAISGFRL